RRAEFGIFADCFANFKAVAIRQHDIQHDEVRPYLAAQRQRTAAGLQPAHRKTFVPQVVLQKREKVRIVLNYYNLSHALSLRHSLGSGPLQRGYVTLNLVLSPRYAAFY